MAVTIHLGDNLDVLPTLDDASFDLVYLDPPFNTGRVRRGGRQRATTDPDAARTGFHGRTYRTTTTPGAAFDDRFDDLPAVLAPRLAQAIRVLKPAGSLFVHLDPREVHYVKVQLDGLLGRDHFMNEIVWAYDYGGRSKRRWSPKHDTILWYARDPDRATFHYDAIDRVPYMAPDLVGPEKAARGKTPTDVWWHTIVPTSGKERTGYPTQKPLGLLTRIVRVHTSPGDRILDCFAGSGTTGEAAARAGRDCVLVDHNPDAVAIMAARLAFADPVVVGAPG